MLENLYYISTIVGVAGALFMLFVAYTQLSVAKEQLRNINTQLNSATLLKIYDEMKDLRPYWHKMFAIYKVKPDFNKWDDEEKAIADRLCVDLEKISFLAVKGFIDESFLIEEYAGIFARTWYRLNGYVKHHRIKRGEPAELTWRTTKGKLRKNCCESTGIS
ncbi:MAG: hypothetical protein LBV47_08400 [Bacteroidales bacterium]|jgi:hypothetical protein|nr:hypothetical protein [Bacteroidales bacterium]